MLPEDPLAFDLAASSYDEEFTFTAIGKLQRRRVRHFLSEILPAASATILEVNCGTGADALWLAKTGHRVTATDASPNMIMETKRKISGAGLEGKISATVCDFGRLKETYTNEEYDLIFSDFGGLNCVSPHELEKLSADFSSLLNSNGRLVAVVMGRKCVWERFYFLCRMEGKQAFRRNATGPVEARVGGSVAPTWYYSPGEFEKKFSPHFRMISAHPIGLFVPPSYLNPFFKNKRWLLSLLNQCEQWFSFSFFSDYADHYVVELIKR